MNKEQQTDVYVDTHLSSPLLAEEVQLVLGLETGKYKMYLDHCGTQSKKALKNDG